MGRRRKSLLSSKVVAGFGHFVTEYAFKLGALVLILSILIALLGGHDAANKWRIIAGGALVPGSLLLAWAIRRWQETSTQPVAEPNPEQMPFAYGAGGGLLVATWAHEVLGCADHNQATLWTYDAADWVTGVRTTDKVVLAVDRNGLLTCLNRDNGAEVGRVDSGRPANALAAMPNGRWAIIHRSGVTLGQYVKIDGYYKLHDTTAAAFGERGDEIAIAAGQSLVIIDRALQPVCRTALGDTPTAVAWSVDGLWLVTFPHRLELISRDLSRRRLVMQHDEGIFSGGVVSPNGRLVACRVNDNEVGLAGVKEGPLGGLSYPDRTVGELEFGPHPYLAVGIGYGDGNLVTLNAPQLARTDPPAGRETHRWLVQMGINYEGVQKELGEGRW